ncbi:hypothetical protein BKP64_04200 [Marinobacter salinus]|uniref:Uncharacterized protein n=1 Tax=Marinobacter salinus TaxID=1874317 RepID=A0A1D9GIG8_9GAMM|nr:phosphoribosyltransferase family protein [Marinobacter salinus]AOY87446.1 hypothetical protein BKP64_04200 [Marinobacter salinus]
MENYRDRQDLLVLALPRGGVPVAYELAEALRAPMDLMLVRKLGTPGQRELAMEQKELERREQATVVVARLSREWFTRYLRESHR